MDTVFRDIRYGLRSLLKRPGFTVIAVLTLALGIGACTAVFSIVDAVLLRSLPYPDADRIVQLREINPAGTKIPFAEPNFLDVRTRSRTLESVAQYSADRTTVTGESEPVRALAVAVSADFFRVLATQPLLGRTFTNQDSKSGGIPVAVIGYGFWQRILGRRSDFSAATLTISDKTFSVIGVMPQGFAFPEKADIWIPRELFPPETVRSAHNWSVVGRVRPNFTVDQARAEVEAIGRQLKQENGKDMDAIGFTAVSQQE